MADAAIAVLTGMAGVEVVGGSGIALDAESLASSLAPLRDEVLDAIVVVQASFADSTLVAEVAAANPAPIVLWAVPEERTGGRLRLNSFCGINLAAYTLRRAGREYRYLLSDPSRPDAETALANAIVPHGGASVAHDDAAVLGDDGDGPGVRAAAVAAALAETTVGLIGRRPDGFEPCDYEPETLMRLTGVRVDPIGLPHLFSTAAATEEESRGSLRREVAESLIGIDTLDQAGVDRSLELHTGMQRLIADRGWGAFATRCWPECFTEYGGAACTAMALCNSAGVPGCCEADVYGSVTSVILQQLTDAPPFVADLVDLDFEDDTGVLWHCGLAPLEMAAAEPAPRATIHSNRAMPLLNEFVLRPGRVTIARLSQAGNESRLVVGGGEMLSRPPAFTGTSGVIRFDASAAHVFDSIMREGLEHHYGIAYGDVRAELYALADELDIAVVALT
jgi:L-fucose isomerase-like protein